MTALTGGPVDEDAINEKKESILWDTETCSLTALGLEKANQFSKMAEMDQEALEAYRAMLSREDQAVMLLGDQLDKDSQESGGDRSIRELSAMFPEAALGPSMRVKTSSEAFLTLPQIRILADQHGVKNRHYSVHVTPHGQTMTLPKALGKTLRPISVEGYTTTPDPTVEIREELTEAYEAELKGNKWAKRFAKSVNQLLMHIQKVEKEGVELCQTMANEKTISETHLNRKIEKLKERIQQLEDGAEPKTISKLKQENQALLRKLGRNNYK